MALPRAVRRVQLLQYQVELVHRVDWYTVPDGCVRKSGRYDIHDSKNAYPLTTRYDQVVSYCTGTMIVIVILADTTRILTPFKPCKIEIEPDQPSPATRAL